MPGATHSRHSRLAVTGCLVYALLVVHVSARYLASTLFGFETYRDLAPIVPFALITGHTLSLAAVAAAVMIYQRTAGWVLGAGLLLLAIKPVTSALIWGDGCEVSSGTGAGLLPEITVQPGTVVVYAWNGACSVSLNIALIGTSAVLVGSGLWFGTLPATLLSRWLGVVERYWPVPQ